MTEDNQEEPEQNQSKLYDRIDSLLSQLETEPPPPQAMPEELPPAIHPPQPQYVEDQHPSIGGGITSFFNNPDRPPLNIENMKGNQKLDDIMADIERERLKKKRLEEMQIRADEKSTQYNQYGLYSLIAVSLGIVLKVLSTGVSLKSSYDEKVKNTPLF